jgi:hypothetical protein
MMPIHDSTLNWRWLHQILWHMGWAQVRAPGLGLELCLNIDTFFKKNTLEERILIPEHQTLISSRAMSSLKVIQI